MDDINLNENVTPSETKISEENTPVNNQCTMILGRSWF